MCTKKIIVEGKLIVIHFLAFIFQILKQVLFVRH